MPVSYNTREAGDDVYEQFTLRKTFELAATVAGVKGNLFTMNAAGRLVAITASGGVVDLSNGVFQAAAPRAARATIDTGDSGPTVQAHMRGGWILIKGAASLLPGMRVVPSASGATVDDAKVMKAPASTDPLNILGTIYEIITKGTTDQFKLVSADNDLVVVQLGTL